ncbi:MAG: primosomal protein N' [Candidatus Magnetoovum sp. WYHC-5]|nr:primosomal protein N' [Candidatus Magnetoovum sp. WYHC-5]
MDVIFPIYLKPLSYICPEPLVIGSIVLAPLKGTVKRGVVYRVYEETANLKQIVAVEEVRFSENHIKLLEWIKDYYHCEIGMAYRAMAFEGGEVCKVKKEVEVEFKPLSVDTQIIKKDSVCLMHTPSFRYEVSVVLGLLKETEGEVIILCPEVEEAKYVDSVVRVHLGKQTGLLHGQLTVNQKAKVFLDAIAGDVKIFIGTVSAALLPVKKPVMFIMLQCQSAYYKHEKVPRFNAREVLLKRAQMEGAFVLLMSPTPSTLSIYNVRTGMYNFVALEKLKRPDIKVINTKRFEEPITGRVMKAIISAIGKGLSVIIFVNRKGHSILMCSDCGHMDRCKRCKTTLVYNKGERRLRCPRCGYSVLVWEVCPKCMGVKFKELGAGTQRIEEFIKAQTGVEPLRVDSDIARTKSVLQGLLAAALKSQIVVGTKAVLKPLLFAGHFHVAVALNPDIYFAFADYLSCERLFEDMSALSEMVDSKGKVYVQTALPSEETYKYLESYDHEGFISYELEKRSMLSYPPFGRLCLITFYFKGETVHLDIPDMPEGVQLLGPVISRATKKGFFKESSAVIIKAVDDAAFYEGIERVANFARQKTLRLDIDVDPVMLS